MSEVGNGLWRFRAPADKRTAPSPPSASHVGSCARSGRGCARRGRSLGKCDSGVVSRTGPQTQRLDLRRDFRGVVSEHDELLRGRHLRANGPFPKGLVAHRNGSHWSSMSQLVPCRVRLVPHGPGGGDGEGRESSTHHPHITPDLGPPVSLRRLALCARDRAGEAASSGTSARSCSTTRGPAKFVRQHSDERILRR